jgi:hypothetical protein
VNGGVGRKPGVGGRQPALRLRLRGRGQAQAAEREQCGSEHIGAMRVVIRQ